MRKKTGGLAEEIVANYLTKCGYEILERNVVYAFGEIDLIAVDASTLVFVEVKYRKNLDFGYPHESVGASKQRKIILAAEAYVQSLPEPVPSCRFDVISLWGDLKAPQIEHITDAFLAEV